MHLMHLLQPNATSSTHSMSCTTVLWPLTFTDIRELSYAKTSTDAVGNSNGPSLIVMLLTGSQFNSSHKLQVKKVGKT